MPQEFFSASIDGQEPGGTVGTTDFSTRIRRQLLMFSLLSLITRKVVYEELSTRWKILKSPLLSSPVVLAASKNRP